MRASTSASHLSHADGIESGSARTHVAANGTRMVGSSSAHQLSYPQDNAERKPRFHHKPTRRQNARMQLAAALIEADNEQILHKAEALRAEQEAREEDDLACPGLGPSPLPEPKLACQSVLFKPWRDGFEVDQDEGEPGGGEASFATPLGEPDIPLRRSTKRIQEIQTNRRPSSVDFLGIKLPGESSERLKVSHSAPVSGVGFSVGWGVDRFLSEDALKSLAELHEHSKRQATPDESTPASLEAGEQATSHQRSASVGPSVPSTERTFSGTQPRFRRSQSDASVLAEGSRSRGYDLRLLARIKAYREGQNDDQRDDEALDIAAPHLSPLSASDGIRMQLADTQADLMLQQPSIKRPQGSDLLRGDSMAGVGSFSPERRLSFVGAPVVLPELGFDSSIPLASQRSGLSNALKQPEVDSLTRPAHNTADFGNVVALQGDLYTALALAESPYPGSYRRFHRSPTFGALESLSPPMPPLQLSAPVEPLSGLDDQRRGSMSPEQGLSTRELQALARQSHFPDSYGIFVPPPSSEEEVKTDRARTRGSYRTDRPVGGTDRGPAAAASDVWPADRSPGRLRRALRPVTGLFSSAAMSTPPHDQLEERVSGRRREPDLSSSKWNPKKGKVRRDITDEQGEPGNGDQTLRELTSTEQSHQEGRSDELGLYSTPELMAFKEEERYDAVTNQEPDVDDDYISPPQKGPLKPKGVDAWLPQILVTPEPLEHTVQMPRTRLSDGTTVAATVVPILAPPGIGRRSNMASTALFRNGLVHNEEEKEGWGWELSSAPRPLQRSEEVDSDQLSSSEQGPPVKPKLTRKEAKARQKRKRARALRREKRAEADAAGQTYEEAGVPEDSPLEDASLSEDSASDNTDFENREEELFVDEQSKPAGKLFGKSLLDVAQERQEEKKAVTRYYGQRDLGDSISQKDGDTASIAPSSAGQSFRDNPFGFNDTRERMRAALGVDANWEREMAERRIKDAEEEEEMAAVRAAAALLQQEKEAKRQRKRKIFGRRNKFGGDDQLGVSGKEACQFVPEMATEAEAAVSSERAQEPKAIESSAPEPDLDADDTLQPGGIGQEQAPEPPAITQPPRIEIGLSSPPQLRSAAGRGVSAWHPASSGSSDESDSESEAGKPKRVLRESSSARLLGPNDSSLRLLQMSRRSSTGQINKTAESADSSDDEVPLSVIKRRTVSSNAVPQRGDASSSDEEVPLAQLRSKWPVKKAPSHASSSCVENRKSDEQGNAVDSEEDRPLGQRHSMLALSTFQQLHKGTLRASDRRSASESSDDDAPLGASHPQAAIIAQQAALIKQLQAETNFHRQSAFLAASASMAAMPFLPPTMTSVPSRMGMAPVPTPSLPDLRAAYLATNSLPRSPSIGNFPSSETRMSHLNAGTTLPIAAQATMDGAAGIDQWRNGVLPGSATPSSLTTTTHSSA
ncbi:hypothetical protein BCV69DRAFT_62674 [Microstroma glucosiphilum]|uniref:Uncharacterized protein n=1 Tax=Pseudomicrostroma glucosiphilum TaxID=1684307 RepID=A0A316U1Q0_9BASI|nr:hypothetical protein BCV69DRAFT_62674 [Pseudomicrostroma glucosiphilum]PWN18778.1 hypothetical protein BCV69DRAFT_62674 [Pseudomicrostroma glucosiphilum]